MTREQYDKAKAEIVEKHGKPEYDMKDPVNESARILNALYSQYKREQLAERREKAKEAGEKQAPVTPEQIVESADKEMRRSYKSIPLDEILLDDNDLKIFNEKEKEILRARYAEMDLSPKELAKKVNISYQKLAAFLNSTMVQVLHEKVWRKIIKFETMKAYLKLLKAGDSRAILRSAEDNKLVSNEKLDLSVQNKPIEDPEVMKMLKEMGDRAVFPPSLPHEPKERIDK